MKLLRLLLLTSGCTLAAGLLGISAARADISINKSFVPNTINPGDISKLTISLVNSATTIRDGAAFEDMLPAGVTIASPTFINNCGGNLILDTVTQKIKLVNGVIPAKVGIITGRCDITVDITSVTNNNKINTILAGALTVNGGETNTTAASATISVNSLASLSGSKSFNPNVVAPGGKTRLKLVLNNTNAISIFATGVTDNLLAAGMTVAPVPNPVFVCNSNNTPTGNGGGQVAIAGNQQSFTISNLTIPAKVGSNNGSCELSIDVLTSTTNGLYTNSIPVNTVVTGRGISNTAFSGSLTVEGNARISKRFGTVGAVGATFPLTITITNGTTVPLTNSSLADNLPTSSSGGIMEYVSSPVPTIICKNAAGATVPTNSGAIVGSSNANRTVNISGLTVPAASALGFGSCDVRVSVKVNALGTYSNIIPKLNFTNSQSILSTVDATANATISNSGTGGSGTTNPVNISKIFAPNSIPANGVSLLTVTINNPIGNQDLTGIALSDNLPAGITLAATPNLATTCRFASSPSVVTNTSSTLVRITNGSLQQGTSCTMTANVTGSQSGVFTNTIGLNSLTSTNNISNSNIATSPLTITPGVRITKAFNGNVIAINGISRMRIDIENFQEVPLTNAGFTDTFPSGIKIANIPNILNTCGGDVSFNAARTNLIFSGGIIPLAFGTTPGKCSIEVDVTKTNTTASTNTIGANSFTSWLNGDPNSIVRNPVAASAILTGVANLTMDVNKSIFPNVISGGANAAMTISIKNNSTAAMLNDVQFTDIMPPGMVISSQPNILNSCGGLATTNNPTTGSSTIKLTNGSIPANGSCTISVQITSQVALNLINTIPTGGVTSREGAINNSPTSASITFLPSPGIAKSFVPATINQGGISRLTVTVSNFSTTSLTNTGLIDPLPPNLSFASLPNTSTTCINGTVSISANSLILTGANISPNSFCTFSADVTSTIVQSYTNIIAANALTNDSGNSNPEPATATIQIITPNRPGLFLVKRVTAINGVRATRGGVSLTTYVDDPSNPYDDNNITLPQPIFPTDPLQDTDRWPNISNFLVGGTDGGTVKPNDVIEYTIYYLSAGSSYAKNVEICDLIPTNQAFVAGSFNGAYYTQTGNISTDRGLLLLKDGMVTILTNTADTDAGRYYSADNLPLPKACRADPAAPLPNNVNGAAIFKIGDLPIAAIPGNPVNASSYGYVRFRVVVK
jgi:uncharacterized repeat protein (TIGR01451 family)